MPLVASPSPANYFIGTGHATWTPEGGSPRDLGNIVECELTPTVDKTEHKTKRTGSAKTDVTRYTNQAVTIRIVLDEITPENLQMLLMSGDPETSGSDKIIRIMKESVIQGALTFTGTNDVGNQVDGDFPSVSFGPSGSFSFIQSDDDFHQIEITGDLLAQTLTDGTSDFGTMTIRPQA